MNKLFLLVLTLSAFSAKAQTSVYHPFPDSNAIWNVRLQDFNYEEDFSYVFSGDTLINGFYYHRIFKPFIYRTGSNMSNQFNYAGYSGCLRQDTTIRKVYIDSAGTDIVLYDFNLQTGDTVKGYFNQGCPYPLVITSIDSILIGSDYRKKWNINNGGWNSFIIEGIGSAFGLLQGCSPPLSPSIFLNCFTQNGQTLYPDTIINCELISNVSTISPRILLINISPNPFHIFGTLELSAEFENAELKIYNDIGTEVRAQIITNQSTVVKHDGLCNGIYFIRLINNKGKVATGKFIIE